MNRRFSKSRRGYVQSLPRYPGGAQRAALEKFELGDIFDEDAMDDARAEMMDTTRRGDVTYVTELHLLARRVKRTNHNMRLDLWDALHDIERRGGSVIETRTGRSTTDPQQRDDMLKDAIEVLTRGHMARATKIARANGALGGRPPRAFSEAQTEAARKAWLDPALHGDKLRRALASAGYSVSRCYQVFGPRGGRT